MQPQTTIHCIQCRLKKPAQGYYWYPHLAEARVFNFCEECWPNPLNIFKTKEEVTAHLVTRILE
jgi:hypothetical protein